MGNAEFLSEKIKSGEFDSLFMDIYIDKNLLEYQKERYIKSISEFVSLFGEGDVEIYSTPGRSEVCGNHTDHQHGAVLATSINLDTIAIVKKEDSKLIRIVSEGYDEVITVDTEDLEYKESESGRSSGLIRGVIRGLSDRGYETGGFTAYITSDVLVGAGLSSSAAFEVIIGTIISGLYNDLKIDAVEIAKIAQFAENVFFNKPCGLMDQTACSVGGLINIDFINPEKPLVRQIHVDFEKNNYSLCIVDTKGSHADLTDDYAMIPGEMKAVAEYFGKEVLREVPKNMVLDNISGIREKLGDRAVLRSLHFYNEQKHVEGAMEALNKENFILFLSIIKESGNTSYKFLQNAYTNHDIEHQAVSVGIALSEEFLGDTGVCRVHGGGFAGTIQAFVPNDRVCAYKEFIEKTFGENSCHILKVRRYGGMKVM